MGCAGLGCTERRWVIAEVVVYTKDYCPYCTWAMRLLDKKGVSYEEIDVTHDLVRRQEMMERSHRRTVPQIFICGEPVGGYDDLVALDRAGKLDALLAQECSAR